MIVASQEAVKHQSLVGIPSGIYGKYLNVVIVASQEAVKNQSLVGILSSIYGKHLNYNVTNNTGYVPLVVNISRSFPHS